MNCWKGTFNTFISFWEVAQPDYNTLLIDEVLRVCVFPCCSYWYCVFIVYFEG